MKKGTIGISSGKISHITESPMETVSDDAKHVIDCLGKVLSPGFIDIHMHEENFLTEGEKFVISNYELLQGATTAVGGQCGVQRQSIGEFKDTIDNLGGAPINYALMTGYNNLRSKMGLGRHDSATEDQIREISEQIKEELKEGSFGISFGIEYDPGMTLNEINAVVDSIEDDDILVAAHYRGDADKSIDSILEMIEIQNNTEKRFQISHLSSCSAMGQMDEALTIINNAMEENPKLNYDTYPYNAFSTMIGSEVFEDGCFEKWGKDYSDILLTDDPYKNVYCTKEIFEDARENYPDMLAVAFVMNEDEIAKAMSNSNGMIASDGIINNGKGHPRAAGTFPRVLGKYVREETILTLYEALEKMSYLPSERLDLTNKGRIEIGADADLIIIDPEIIKDCADYETLEYRPEGIEYIFIDGSLAVKNNEIINPRLGKFIERI